MCIRDSFPTRAPRPGEEDGRHYHFIDVQRFLAMRERGEFAEWAEVHDNFYGTSRTWLEQGMRKGCLLYTSPSPRDRTRSRMPSSA